MKNVVIAGYVRSPFHLARKGDLAKVRPDEMAGQVVKALIEASADVNKADNDGVTPLHSAALVGLEAVVNVLIEAGADVNETSNNGDTPLSSAAWKGHDAVVKVLIEAGADVNKLATTARRR